MWGGRDAGQNHWLGRGLFKSRGQGWPLCAGDAWAETWAVKIQPSEDQGKRILGRENIKAMRRERGFMSRN